MKYFTEEAEYYMTRKVNDQVDKALIDIILTMIYDNNQKGFVSDYFKVFKFSNIVEEGKKYLLVTHTQECPELKVEKKVLINDDTSVFHLDCEFTLWVISDGICNNKEIITFLFPDEY